MSRRCVETNVGPSMLTSKRDLYMGRCDHRNPYQKWFCEYDRNSKSFYVVPEGRENSRWFIRPEDKQLTVTSQAPRLELSVFVDRNGANPCDFDKRDPCSQTVAKIPSSDATCLVSAKGKKQAVQSYAEIKISGKKPIVRDFTIFMWVKVRLSKNVASVGLFSYYVNNRRLLGLTHFTSGRSRIHFFDHTSEVDTNAKNITLEQTAWVLISVGRFSRYEKKWLRYYINDELVHKARVSYHRLPGTGIFRLGQSIVSSSNTFNGLITRFEIVLWKTNSMLVRSKMSNKHCCFVGYGRPWLAWKDVINTWTLHGNTRVDRGVQCTSFEKITDNWTEMENARETCSKPFMVADERYFPQYHFSSSSWTSAGKTSYGRASTRTSGAWCPENNDRNSYLQIDLGRVRNVTAAGTMKKIRNRHASKIKIDHSENGIDWKSDGQIYDVTTRLFQKMKIVKLVLPVRARYLRFYPKNCLPVKCCLAVEVYGCEPEFDKKIVEPVDGCTRTNKPYILMALPTQRHITMIQLTSRRNQKPIREFYMYFESWEQWLPYQVNGKIKVFSGNSDVTRSFTHILPIPLLTSAIKIYPAPYGVSTCSDIEFFGCNIPRRDLCTPSELRHLSKRFCAKRPIPRCSLGYFGNGHTCKDFNECDVSTGQFCDPNSVCKNKHGSFTCDPCKNSFIGDGRICQTSCEALGIKCGNNSYCDIDQCKCQEGFIKNGTQCVFDIHYGEVKETKIQPNKIDGLCPDGFFNCYGDVIGALNKMRKASTSMENFDYDECSSNGDH
ncbi:uncharacterized protein LOC124443899 [Xenia sp. Carnegie-2017]|uniref:uncharacterized protein LOC124443899 n=1 Tax=Xenia sp. Carnegie-2017 TaxID=2897299 RepID=UPI001F04F59C|nr:uncharacterized protein LOC124443899 [Xenia sp. Carnegie-2017]